jgi:hypothetical protein
MFLFLPQHSLVVDQYQVIRKFAEERVSGLAYALLR